MQQRKGMLLHVMGGFLLVIFSEGSWIQPMIKPVYAPRPLQFSVSDDILLNSQERWLELSGRRHPTSGPDQ